MSSASSSPAEAYSNRKSLHAAEAAALGKRVHRMGNVRLLIFVIAVVAVIAAVKWDMAITALLTIVLGIVAFVMAVVRHHKLTQSFERAQRLVDINQEGLQRLSGEWHQRVLRGDNFIDKEHACSSDLDLFGQHSVFQWCCTARTLAGQATLASMLREPAPAIDIPQRQEAIKELATKLDWRQRLEADAMVMEDKQLNAFCQWTEAPSPESLDSAKARWLLWLPLPTALLWIGTWTTGIPILAIAAMVLLVLQVLLAGIISRALTARITTWLKWESEATTVRSLLAAVEEETYTAPLNQRFKNALHTDAAIDSEAASKTCTVATAGVSASESFGILEGIIGKLSMRYNPFVHFIFNSALLWDLRCAIAAEKWRKQCGHQVRGWLATFSQVEALCSLSVIHFDHPEWVFADVAGEANQATSATAASDLPLKAIGLGHPLLASNECVTNDFTIHRSGSAAIITGSNMSGKSTFLRTVGVNLVLAYAGAPVCAREFHCSVRPIYTSMRIADDLSRGVSSFYAELLRIKRIVDAAQHQPILYLIDEIFRGTNSGDRIAGAQEVLKVLSQSASIGLVSTHDLELSKLAIEQPDHFTNYHFSEHYTESGIDFSYQIQPGPSTTTNARHLIRMVGITSSTDSTPEFVNTYPHQIISE